MDTLLQTPSADSLHPHPSKKPRRDNVRIFALVSALGTCAIVLLILVTLIVQSGPAVLGASDSLFSTRWNPADGVYGIIPMVFGSVFVMMIAMGFALPIGLLAAIAVSQINSPALKRAVKSALEILAGIPSIVYGLIGVAYVSLWVAGAFDLQSGRIILTAGIILAVMILPTFLSLSEDAISGVPKAYHENAAALGLYPYETQLTVILPVAAPGIASAALLALGRALGETMAVMLVIGSLDRLPSPLFNPLSSGQTITSKLGREVGESAFGSVHFSVLVLMSLILVTFTIGLTITSRVLFKSGPLKNAPVKSAPAK